MFGSHADLVRYFLSLPGFALFATNFVFVGFAPKIFPRQTCTFWRLFFVGKSIITAAAIYYMLSRSGPLTAGAFTAFSGYIISLGALLFAYIKRPFVGVPLSSVRPSDTDLTIVEGETK